MDRAEVGVQEGARRKSAGLKVDPSGKPWLAAARDIGKVQSRDLLYSEFDPREISEPKSQSIGNPKMVLHEISGPKAKERVTGDPSCVV